MFRTSRQTVSIVLIYLLTFLSIQPTPLRAGNPPLRFVKRVLKIGDRTGVPPLTGQDHAIERLAKNIDWLEHEIDHWGTVVAKTPDVWGEARLTKYRREVEKQLSAEVSKFEKGRLSGAQFVSDQAFLAAAASFRLEPGLLSTSRVAVPQTSISIATSTTAAGDESEEGGDEGEDDEDGDDSDAVATAGPVTGLQINPSNAKALFGLSEDKLSIGGSIKLEQTTELDQMKRYLDHLNELRRINEGDDTADAPGYSMNLVRIPVSVLPGTKSDKGYGAEITVSATAEVGPELLPNAFRDMVINDLVDQLALPLTKLLNQNALQNRDMLEKFYLSENPDVANRRIKSKIEEFRGRRLVAAPFNVLLHESIGAMTFLDGEFRIQRGLTVDVHNVEQFAEELKRVLVVAEELLEEIQTADPASSSQSRSKGASTRTIDVGLLSPQATFLQRVERFPVAKSYEELYGDPGRTPDARLRDWAGWLNKWKDRFSETTKELKVVAASATEMASITSDLKDSIGAFSLSSSTRRSVLPFPPSQLTDIFGPHELLHVASDTYQAFLKDAVNRQVVHLTDVQSYLREEVSAAYELLAASSLWEGDFATEFDLYRILRSVDTATIAIAREQFFAQIDSSDQHRSVEALAWCIFVDSILLNERLIKDIRDTTAGTGSLLVDDVWLPFYGPNPPQESRDIFAEYVRKRWPLKVFTVDPVNNEQNIADVASFYREMQLAVAVSFAAGEIGASAAMQTLRRLQRDSATIDLNKTIVGFSHGDDTFGWRFYPRFQTPPVEGNATVFFRDLLVGGPTDKQLTRSKELEPGMRECVAIVLMPSFISHVTFDTRGNWFKLGKAGHTANSVQEAVHYSRAVQAMRTSTAECSRCEHLYRDGELARLMRRVDQLDRELPLQTLRCQVPDEMTLGGFEILASGTRELAPELLGWYGAPGYDAKNGATLFLAGDNFSVHETVLIAGNKQVDAKLLSRQILQVTLPKDLPIIKDERIAGIYPNEYAGFVDAVVATPYGASGHLLIPALNKEAAPVEPKFSQLKISSGDVTLTAVVKDNKIDSLATEKGTLGLMTIEAAKESWFGSKPEKATLTLQMSRGSDRLRPVVVADVPRDTNKFVIGSPKTIDLLKNSDKGLLFQSLSHYLDYVMNYDAAFPAAFAKSKAVELEVKGEIASGTTKLPFENSIKFKITLDGYVPPVANASASTTAGTAVSPTLQPTPTPVPQTVTN